MINLLTKSEGLVEVGQKYRGVIHAVTTVVAVVYLVAVAASAGWWVWVGVRKSAVVGERDVLVGQVGQLAAAEAVVRQVISRTQMVEEALARPKLEPILVKVREEAQKKGLEVVGWQAGVVTVSGPNIGVLEEFAQGREVKSVTKQKGGLWEEAVVWK